MSPDSPHLQRYPNGFQLLLVPSPAAPVLAAELWVGVGSADEAPDQAGISHLVEHMLFKGTQRRPPGAIAREIEAVGGDINASTGLDHTVYELAVASRFADLALDILADALFSSRFDPGELARERDVVLEELRRSDDLPHHQLSQLLFREAYRVHPYGRPVAGSPDTVRTLDSAACRRFVEHWYRPDNMVLVLAGDLDPAALIPSVAQQFGSRSAGAPRARHPRPEEPAAEGMRCALVPWEVSECYFELAFPGPTATHPDVPAVDLLSAILGQGEASRLQRRVKLDRNLVCGVGAGAYAPDDPGLLTIGGVAENDRFAEAYQAICEEVFRLCQEPASRGELQRARDNLEADFIYQKETAEGLAHKAGYFHVQCGGVAAEQRYLEALRGLDAETLHRTARRYLRSEAAVLALLHPEQAPPGSAQEITNITKRCATAPPGVRSVRRSPGPAVLRRELPGGIRLLLRENHQVPLVALRAAIPGGLLLEPAPAAGAFHLLAHTGVCGTQTRNVYRIADEVDTIGGQLEGFSGRSSFGLRSEFLARHLELGLELFCDVLRHPAFPAAEVDKAREDSLAALRLRHDDPSQWVQRLFEATLYGEHPYGRDVLGREDSVTRLDAAALRDLFQRATRPEQLALAVAGDVDGEQVYQRLAAALDGWDVPHPKLTPPAPPAAPERPLRVEHRAPVQQAHLVVGFLGTRVDAPDRHALRVAESMLAGQGGRLFQRLREQQGLAYAVGCCCVEGLHAGYVAAHTATAPERAEQALDAMLQEFQALATGQFTAAEVTEAQSKLVGSYEIGLQENASQAAQLALEEAYAPGSGDLERYARDILSVTVDEVAAAAAHHFRLETHAAALLLPR